ncbi:FG-GAP-like repeat-containing protein [Candidatus Magnetobacterium casense]|uniref:FG-GAP-like repeat-containing protein n=1 Tax=Candidatus Magnetobacterium casense TaxID=1455061 RepID=UPI00138E072D|nr:FG-GAP-like repeat-containing protein [Candidatus Magnetobacterium casensis]
MTLLAFGMVFAYGGGVARGADQYEYAWTKTLLSGWSNGGNDCRFDTATQNLITVGFFTQTINFHPAGGSDSRSSSSFRDWYVWKMDSDATYTKGGWSRTGYSGSVNDWLTSVVSDSSGNIYTCGGEDTGSYPSAWGPAGIITKFSPDGTRGWSLQYGSLNNYAPCNSIELSSDGYLYATGGFQGTVTFAAGITKTSVGAHDVYLLKATKDGTVVWVQTFGGAYTDYGNSVATDAQNNIYLGGYSYPSSDVTNGFLRKYDSSGNMLWKTDFTGAVTSKPNFVHQVKVNSEGNVLVGGYFSGTLTIGTTTLTSSVNNSFISKISPSGQVTWLKSLSGSGSNGLAKMMLDANNNIYLGGAFQGTFDLDPGSGVVSKTAVGSNDSYMLKLSKDGDYLWSRTIGSASGTVGLSGFCLNPANNDIYVTGEFSGTINFNTDTGGEPVSDPAVDSSMFVSKYKATSTTIPLTPANWNEYKEWVFDSTGNMSVTSDGLQFNGYGYRVGAELASKSTFNFIGSETYIKWKAHGAGYMGAGILLWNTSPPTKAISIGSMTTHHSWEGSVVISDDTWYYTRIKVNSDNTYQSVTATGNYDNNGGTVFLTVPGTITNQSDFQNGAISALLGDNYGGTASYVTLGEVKTTATSGVTPTPTPTYTYTVTPSAGTGGTITPSTPQTVTSGATTQFTVTPNTGYSIGSVTGCGGSLSGNTYTTGAITANCTVMATFSIIPPTTYTVTATANTGGSISCTPTSVSSGGSSTCTITPNSNFNLSALTDNGASVFTGASQTTYTITNITANHTVVATFTLIPTPPPTPTPTPTPCTYTISPTIKSFPAAGGSDTVSVAVNSSCSWTATSNVSWIKFASGNSGAGIGTIGYTVEAYTGTTSRTGTITIEGKTLTVTQLPPDCAITINPTSKTFTSPSGDSGSFSVSSGCTWTATSNNTSWLTVTTSGTGTVNYTVAANTATTPRTGTITVAGQNATATFTVTQPGSSNCTYTITPTIKDFLATGGTGDVTVKTSTSACQWTATSGVDWITVTSGSAVTGAGVVSYSVAVNTTQASRTGTITIAGQTFTVNQEPACTYTIAPTNKKFNVSGGKDSVIVTAAGSGCSWTAASNNSWITITSGSSGSGSDTVYYLVAANTSTEPRLGTMTIAGQTFTVTQDSGGVTLTLKITGNGSGTVAASTGKLNCSSDGKTCLASYVINDVVILTATPAQGSTVKGWTGCDTTTVTGGSQCTLTMSKDMDVSVEFSVPITPIYDFDGDGKSDVIWRSSQSGDVFIWLMNKFSLTGGDYVVKGITADWDIKGIADFNGDGKNDIVWQHKDKGDVYMYIMNGTQISAHDYALKGLPKEWEFKKAGDFDGDGKADILWQSTESGDVAVWLMNGKDIKSGGFIVKGMRPEWTIRAVADLDGNKKADIIWQNTDGDIVVWLMDGTTISKMDYSSRGIPGSWQIKAVVDFDGDGKADLLWQDIVSGDVAMWLMDGFKIVGGGLVSHGMPNVWQILSVADYDGNGKADIFWKNTGNGDVYAWFMDGVAISDKGYVVMGMPPEWQAK